MAAEDFQKNSLDWQIQQLGRRVGEWIEIHFPRFKPPIPDAVPFSSWWIEVAFWLIIGAFILWFGYLLYRWLRPYFDPNHPQIAKLLDRSAPAPKERTIAGWVRAAQEFQRQGNYREACRSLYMAMLQRLNETKLVPTDQSRTDREYSRLVQLLPQSDAYQTLLETHELLCFGNAPISAEMFDRVQQAYGTIERATLDMTKMA